MFWAIVNNEKVRPQPNTFGTCPTCDGKVHSKCGEINEWHWAHYKGQNCDPWYEPESHWHLDWKMTFGKECAEQVIRKNNEIHRADVLTKENVVIELQNSPIRKGVILEREEFYGQRMLWLINGSHFKNNFQMFELDGPSHRWSSEHYQIKNKIGRKAFQWNHARRSWAEVNRHVFIDFGADTLFWVRSGMGTKTGIGIFITKKDFIIKYDGDYEYYQEQFELRRKEEEQRQLEIKKKEEAEKSKRVQEGFIRLMKRYKRKKRW